MRLLSKLVLVSLCLLALPAAAEPPVYEPTSARYSPRVSTVQSEEHAALSAAVQTLLVSGKAPAALKPWRIQKVAVVDPGTRAMFDEIPQKDRELLVALKPPQEAVEQFQAMLPYASQLGRPLALTASGGFESNVGSGAQLTRRPQPFPSVFSPVLRSSLEKYYEMLEKKHPGFGARVSPTRVGFSKDRQQALTMLRLEKGPGKAAHLWVLLTRNRGGAWNVKSWKLGPAT